MNWEHRNHRLLFLASALALFFVVSSSPSWGATIYSADYFAAASAQTCTAESVSDVNTWYRQYRYGGFCPGVPGYAVRKGQGTYPFGSEVFVENTASGYIDIISEVTSRLSTGKVTDYRVFRDQATGVKGMPWLPLTFNSTTGKAWVSNTWLEHWVNSAGAPSCNATVNQYQDPFHSTLDLVEYLGIWPAYVQDRRGGSPNPNAWHDVRVIKKTGIWGVSPEFTEIYYYAQFRNPTTLAWEGIGLIGFEVFENGTPTIAKVMNKIVGCTRTILCGACPP